MRIIFVYEASLPLVVRPTLVTNWAVRALLWGTKPYPACPLSKRRTVGSTPSTDPILWLDGQMTLKFNRSLRDGHCRCWESAALISKLTCQGRRADEETDVHFIFREHTNTDVDRALKATDQRLRE